MASELEQAHGDLMAWSGNGSLLKLVLAHEAAIRQDERVRCWQEIRASMRELCREDSPLALNLVGGGFSLYGPGTEDVSWPVAVDRLLVPDHLLRVFDRQRPGTGYRSADDQDD